MNARVMPQVIVVPAPEFSGGSFDGLENLSENEKVFTNPDGYERKLKKIALCNNNISGGEELEGPLEDS